LPPPAAAAKLPPSATVGVHAEPRAAVGEIAEPTAAAGENAEPRAAAGVNTEPPVATGVNTEPHAAAAGVQMAPRAAAEVRPKFRSGRAASPAIEEAARHFGKDRVDPDARPFAGDASVPTGLDGEGGSYETVRRALEAGKLPSPSAVRVAEMVNQFRYDYPAPTGEHPVAVSFEVTESPWAKGHRLVRVGLASKDLPKRERPPTNLVFLIDVSASMAPWNRLPLVQQALAQLTRDLGALDRIAIVVYAGASGLVLAPTAGTEQATIVAAVNRLHASASLAETPVSGGGIELAYQTAAAAKTPGSVNRVVLATDGDFNVGVTSREQLVRLVQAQARSGISLSVLGFGAGELKDATLALLASRGGGRYAFVDSLDEARAAFVQEIGGARAIASKNVELRAEMNPATVATYRLLGYDDGENAPGRRGGNADIAREFASGHQVTALYEIVPRARTERGTGSSKDAKGNERTAANTLMTVRVRYRETASAPVQTFETVVRDEVTPLVKAHPETRFAAGVAELGLLLRGLATQGVEAYDQVIDLALTGLTADESGERRAFLELAKTAKSLSGVPHDSAAKKP
jgi:Ca-activated chloride channel family protein